MPKSVSFDRSQVLNQVTELFWKKGFHATSMQDLVDATGLNRSSIYNSFGDKHQLFEEALLHYQTWQSQLATKSFGGSDSPLESIRNFFQTQLSNIKNDLEKKGCFLSNCTTELASSDIKIQKMLSTNKNAMVQIFEGKLKSAQALGEIDASKDAHIMALYLYTSLQGLQITSILMSEQTELDALVEMILKNL